MSRTFISIVAVIAFVAPVSVFAATDPLYKQCQKACAGNGLTCVHKCVEAEAASSKGQPADVIVSDGSDAYDNMTPAERARLLKAARERKQPAQLPAQAPVVRPRVVVGGGGRRR